VKPSTIIAIILVIIAAFAIYMLLCYKGFVPEPYDGPYNTIMGYVGNFDAKAMISNPATLLAAVGGISAVAIPLISKITAAKQQVTQITDSAKTQLSSLTAEKDALQTEINQLKSQVSGVGDLSAQTKTATEKAAELQTKLNNLQTNFDSISQQKTSYQNQYEEAKALVAKYQAQLEVLTPKVK
jgi:septal ring factor EnvC (AmiA/AmiB activator)